MDMLVMRALFNKSCSATLNELLDADLETVMKVNEFIDIKDSIDHQNQQDSEK